MCTSLFFRLLCVCNARCSVLGEVFRMKYGVTAEFRIFAVVRYATTTTDERECGCAACMQMNVLIRIST